MNTNEETEETFEVGQTVYSTRSGKPYTVRRISPSGQLAFGEPPYNSGSYVSRYCYTADAEKAKTKALEIAKLDLHCARRAVVMANKDLEEAYADIARLTAELEQLK
jgi:hypothetical protein